MLIVTGDNKPGLGARIADGMAAAGINMSYLVAQCPVASTPQSSLRERRRRQEGGRRDQARQRTGEEGRQEAVGRRLADESATAGLAVHAAGPVERQCAAR